MQSKKYLFFLNSAVNLWHHQPHYGRSKETDGICTGVFFNMRKSAFNSMQSCGKVLCYSNNIHSYRNSLCSNTYLYYTDNLFILIFKEYFLSIKANMYIYAKQDAFNT